VRITTPTVATNLSDYVPGSAAKITASGFGADLDIKFGAHVINSTKCAALSVGGLCELIGRRAFSRYRGVDTVGANLHLGPGDAELSVGMGWIEVKTRHSVGAVGPIRDGQRRQRAVGIDELNRALDPDARVEPVCGNVDGAASSAGGSFLGHTRLRHG